MGDQRKQDETKGRASRFRGHPPLPAALRRAVSRFAKEIRQEHGLLDRATADRFSRLVRASVTARRKPGRKTSTEVLRAVELRDQGASWSKVYGAVIPNYWSLSYPDRFWRSYKLRGAVNAHFRRRRRTRHTKRPSEKQQ